MGHTSTEGIANPIGIKLGPSSDPAQIVEIIRKLNPKQEEGKLVLITRYGQGRVKEHLPKMIQVIKESGEPVVWSADPMHGNAIKASNGVKTRDFNAILSELQDCFDVHAEMNNCLGGIHFELPETMSASASEELLESQRPVFQETMRPIATQD